jgi:Heterokaryon incompatibility protein (HET)
MDFSRIRLWPLYCDENHLNTCRNIPTWQVSAAPSSIILIDLQRNCLVQIPGKVTNIYVALSYVWGNIEGVLESTTDNFSQLCLSGSLSKPENVSRMPRTVSDAMTVSRAMGVKFLWVDRLCIIQNNSKVFTNQLQQMASIYSNSYFTIIAADGPDANYGLSGSSRDSPRSTSFSQLFLSFGSNIKMVEKHGHESYSKQPVWHTRAWTFQERALSPRTLVFTGSTVYWRCRSAYWYEALADEPDGRSHETAFGLESSFPSFELRVRPWPDTQQYFNLVQGYNSRNLTFESDAQNAFTAILTVMSHSFPGGFHFGIPAFLFDIGILWSRMSSLKRRNSFPSWSWLGWFGRVGLPMGYTEAARIWQSHDVSPLWNVRIEPMIEWYTAHRYGGIGHAIDNSYHKYSSAIHGSDVLLPEGWAKARNSQHEPGYGYRHTSIPEHVFDSPFPVSSFMENALSDCSPSYLKIRAKTCVLLLGSFSVDNYAGCLDVFLQDETGRWAGVVESLFTHENEYARGCHCEVVAISRGYAEKRSEAETLSYSQVFKEMDEVGEVKDLSWYAFYNVLWIETVDGVAYRKAVGRVWNDVWDRQPVKEVDILLG